MGLYDKIFKPKKLVLANGKVVEERCSRAPLIIVLLVIATWISVKVTGFSMTTLVTRIRFFFDILAQMFPPKVGYISSIWGPLFDTIKISARLFCGWCACDSFCNFSIQQPDQK